MILAVERIVLLFAAWLLVAIVVVRALSGELPVEISGRGVRFADAATAQHGVVTSEATFERIDDEIRALQEAVAVLETGQDQRAEQRRYAMKGERDDH